MTCFWPRMNADETRSRSVFSRGLIVTSFYKPHLGIELLINPIKTLLLRPLLEHYIPFISRPAIVAPPIPGRPPWPGKTDDLAVNTSLLSPRTDLCWPALLNLDQRSQWRTKHPETQRKFRISNFEFRNFCPSPFMRFRFHSQGEVFHAERIRTMSVEQSR